MRAITPYLNFDGNCREAMTFYHTALGGDLTVQTFGDVDPNAKPESRDRVMHARITRGSMILMASDTMPEHPFVEGTTVALSVDCETADEVDRLHAALSAGGRDVMPPQDTFWNARFAMANDRYGKQWMFNHEKGR